MRSGTPTAVRFSESHGTVLVREQLGLTLAESQKAVAGTLGFCELCWRQSERAQATSNGQRYKRKRRGATEAITDPSPTPETADLAVEILDVLLHALDGELHPEIDRISTRAGVPEWRVVDFPFLAPRMVMWIGMNHFAEATKRFNVFFGQAIACSAHRSARSVPELAQTLCALIEDAVIRQRRVPAELSETPGSHSSQRFCALHNQYRGDEARRLYKRDHGAREKFEQIIEEIKSRWLCDDLVVVRNGDIDTMTRLRMRAYQAVHTSPLREKRSRTGTKKGETIARIKDLLQSGVSGQADIARTLGISRAAVSIALKRTRTQATAREEDTVEARGDQPHDG